MSEEKIMDKFKDHPTCETCKHYSFSECDILGAGVYEYEQLDVEKDFYCKFWEKKDE